LHASNARFIGDRVRSPREIYMIQMVSPLRAL